MFASVAIGCGLVFGGEEDGLPVMQKRVSHPLLTSLVGSWITESEGAFGKEKGTVRFSLGVGDTATLEDYESSTESSGKTAVSIHGLGVYKVSEDGKTLTKWWFDDQSPGILVLTGPITDAGWDLSGNPNGDKRTTIRATLERSADGLQVALYVNGSRVWSERCKRPPK